MSNTERRREVRARITLPAQVLRRGAAESVEMIDASYRGLFLRFQNPPSVRELIRLRIKLPSRDIELHAVVVRIVVDALGRPGVGLRFFALNGQDRTDWDNFIASVLRVHARAA